jgi:hypothetical protein
MKFATTDMKAFFSNNVEKKNGRKIFSLFCFTQKNPNSEVFQFYY